MSSKVISYSIITLSSIILLFSCSTEVDSCSLTNKEAIIEIEQIEIILSEHSPYIENNSHVLTSLDSLIIELHKIRKIDKNEFSIKVKTILAQLGDRHFNLEYLGKCKENDKYYLPFSLAPWKDSGAVALVKKPKITFSYYLEDFPFLTSINDEKIIDFINQNVQKNKSAPKYSQHAIGIEELNEFHEIKPDLNVGDQMKFTFASRDFKSDTTFFLNLVESKNKWRDVDSYLFFEKNNDKLNQLLFRQYENQIVYIKIPEMYSYTQNRDYFKWLEQKMDTVINSKALIIDIRNNSGGNRDLIDFFSNYFIPPNTFVVANLAKYKGDISNDTRESLTTRRLYPYSHFKDVKSKQAIDSFMENFHPIMEMPEKLYSEYHYMVLSRKSNFNSNYYDKPVFILTNEMTFSAAGVFASAFKGIKNIKIAGVATDGSSGMSKTYDFKKSETSLTISHMLSYQKNGELFDGVGTTPDIEIHRSTDQVLGHEDYQIKKLLEIIQENLNEKK